MSKVRSLSSLSALKLADEICRGSACRKEPGFGMWVCSSVTVKAMQARVLSMSRELSSRLTCSTVQTLGVRS